MAKLKVKTYVFDLDNTLCKTEISKKGKPLYNKSSPIIKRIKTVNKLYDLGNTIIIDTARGSTSGINYYDLTFKQLNEWGLKFHILRTGEKFTSDFYIDDKAINSSDFFK